MSEEKPAAEPSQITDASGITGTGITSTGITGATGSVPAKRSWFKLFVFAVGGAVVGLVALVAATLFLEGKEGLFGGDSAAKPPPQPQLSATEIIAQEFAGKIEVAPVAADALTEPPPSELPTTAELESRDFDEEVKDMFGDDEKDKKASKDKKNKSEKPDDKKAVKSKDKPGRKVAAVDKSLKFTFDKGASKVSKNLDKKKVMSFLAKKLEDNCQPSLPADAKSLKAEIKVSKSGAISNVKVTPNSAEPELAKCLRKKLADAKVLKPKDKAVAKITLQFKSK